MDLWARTGLVDVNSDQGECPLMDPPVGTLKNASHEAHVAGDKWQRPDVTGNSIGLRYGPVEVSEADEAVEVSNGDRFGIYRIESYARRPRPEHMKETMKDTSQGWANLRGSARVAQMNPVRRMLEQVS